MAMTYSRPAGRPPAGSPLRHPGRRLPVLRWRL